MRWLITPQGIPVLVAIVGVISGVVGGVVSQVVAGVFKIKGDTRIINAAKVNAEAAEKRWEQEQEFERQKILADDRRKLFLKTAHALQRMREHLAEREWADENHWHDAWTDGVKIRADGLFMLETELRILAPALTNNVRAATKTARILRDSPWEIKNVEVERLRGEFLSYTMASMEDMRKALGTEPIDASQLTPTEQAHREGLLP